MSLALGLGGFGLVRTGQVLAAKKKAVKTHKVPATRDKYLTTQYKKQNRDQITKIASGQAVEAAAYYEAYLTQLPEDLESLFGMAAACAQTCPSDAIVFGNLRDDASRANQLAQQPRSYHALQVLNTRPGVTYLAKVRRSEEDNHG